MNDKGKKTLRDILSGMLMGIAAAIPGVSGGTIAIMLGVYDRHLDHMNNLRKKFFPNLLALLPLAGGILLGVVPAIIVFNLAFKYFVFGVASLFAGFIIGGIPSITDVIKKDKFKPVFAVILVISLLISAGLGVMSALLGDKINMFAQFNMTQDGSWIEGGHVAWWLYLLMIPMGVIASIALIVPGISGSMILLVAGVYNPLLRTVDIWKEILKGNGNAEMAFSVLGLYLSLLIGIIVGFFTVVKLMKFLFEKYKIHAYYGILGFVLGSLVALYYNFDIVNYYSTWNDGVTSWLGPQIEIPVGAVLLIAGVVVSYLLVRYERKQNGEKEKTQS